MKFEPHDFQAKKMDYDIAKWIWLMKQFIDKYDEWKLQELIFWTSLLEWNWI